MKDSAKHSRFELITTPLAQIRDLLLRPAYHSVSLTRREIQEQLKVRAATVGKVLDALEALGRIVRAPQGYESRKVEGRPSEGTGLFTTMSTITH